MMGTVIVAFAVLLRFALAKRELDLARYDMELRRAKISDDRHFFEAKMAELAARLAASEDRWRDANQLLISGTRIGRDAPDSPSDSPFLRAFGLTAASREIDHKLVLVLTPFSDEEADTFKCIQETCSRIGLNAVRGDEIFTRGDILTHVLSLIVKARLVIANVSSRNANVYYELGITHALNKQTILISRSISQTPFDLKNQRIVIFRDLPELRTELTAALARALTDPKNPSINSELRTDLFSHGGPKDV